MIASNCDTGSAVKPGNGPAKAATVSTSGGIFLGIEMAKARHLVARFVPGGGVKPTAGLTTATLLARVEKYRKAELVRVGQEVVARGELLRTQHSGWPVRGGVEVDLATSTVEPARPDNVALDIIRLGDEPAVFLPHPGRTVGPSVAIGGLKAQ
jgi:hypothetical protein